jgi:hypothetical protein
VCLAQRHSVLFTAPSLFSCTQSQAVTCCMKACCAVLCRTVCLQDFNNALKLAAGPLQRDVVYQAMGADAAAAGDWKAAGEHLYQRNALALYSVQQVHSCHCSHLHCPPMCKQLRLHQDRPSSTSAILICTYPPTHMRVGRAVLCRPQARTMAASCLASPPLRSWRSHWWSQGSLRHCRPS